MAKKIPSTNDVKTSTTTVSKRVSKTSKEVTQTVEPKVFNTIYDIVVDPKFIELLENDIKEIHKARRKRPEPKPGFYYKRDWYDRMSDMDALNVAFLIKHIPDIWLKKSNLSSEIRSVIQQVCEFALQRTVLYYNPTKTESDAKLD